MKGKELIGLINKIDIYNINSFLFGVIYIFIILSLFSSNNIKTKKLFFFYT